MILDPLRQDPHETRWIFASVVDVVMSGALDKSAFAMRALKPQVGNKKTILDLFLFKKGMRDHVVNNFMASLALPEPVKVAIRENTATHGIYRKHVKPLRATDAAESTPAGKLDLTWKRGWTMSAELTLQLVEGLAFDAEYDPSLKNGLKNRKGFSEMLEYAQIKEKIAEIKVALEKEATPPPTTGSSAGTAGAGKTASGSELAGDGTEAGADLDTKDAEDRELFEDHWRKYAERIVDSHVTLIAEPATEQQLVTRLKEQAVIKTIASVKGADYVGVFWCTGLSSESITEPHIRGAPFKKERLLKCGKAFLRARQDAHGQTGEPMLGPGDLFSALDNQKLGLVPKLISFLKDGSGKPCCQVKRFTLVYDYDSIKARKCRVKGVGTINQTETMIMATSDLMVLPVKPHRHYTGFNTGSVIFPIRLSPFTECWAMTFDEKKAVYGKARLPVGGKGDDSGDSGEEHDGADDGDVPPIVDQVPADSASMPAESPSKKLCVRAGSNREPLSYNSIPFQFFDDVAQAFCIKEAVDFTPADGENALTFIKARRGYIGICWTDSHADKLRLRLIEQVLKAFGTNGDALFHSAYASGFKQKAPEVVPKPPDKDDPKKKGGGKVDKAKDNKDKKGKEGTKKKGGKEQNRKQGSSSSSSSASDSGDSA